jgi:hypothetical protein
VEAIREYNGTMLFLAEGGSYEAVQGRVGVLTRLLGRAFPVVSAAGSFVNELSGRLERARSAQEFRQAFAVTTVPGENCEDRSTSATPPDSANGALDDLSKVAACMAIIPGIYASFRGDTSDFYAAQYRKRGGALAEIAAENRSRALGLVPVLQGFSPPSDDRVRDAIAVLNNDFSKLSTRVSRPQQLVTTERFGSSGPAFDMTAFTAFNTLARANIDAMTEKVDALDNAARGYHAALGTYVGLIDDAERYLAEVERAATQPVDRLAQAERLVRLGFSVESGAVSARDGLQAAAAVLLGTAGN